MMAASIAQRVTWSVGLALLLTIGAMLRYPGGTPLDATSHGYVMSRNFLSDLGMTVAYNGQPNRVGASFFVASLLLLILGLGGGLAAIVHLLWTAPDSRRWARAAAGCGLLACAAFAGVAVTPENRVMGLHVGFTVWAWRLLPMVAGLMAAASLQNSLFRRRVVLAWSLVAMLLSGYAALMAWGPSLASADGLRVQVIAQKVATVVVVSAFVYVASEADRARRKNERRS